MLLSSTVDYTSLITITFKSNFDDASSLYVRNINFVPIQMVIADNHSTDCKWHVVCIVLYMTLIEHIMYNQSVYNARQN